MLFGRLLLSHFYKIMETILFYTFVMMGITFLVGFAVAGLIKMVTNLLTLSHGLTLKELVYALRNHSTAEWFRELRLIILSESKEDAYDAFRFFRSHNLHQKKAVKTPDIFAYLVSRNTNEKKRKLPEIFDYAVSHNNL